MEAQRNRLSLGSLVFAVYMALSPIHQTLRLAGGGTVTKYLALAVMIILVLEDAFIRGVVRLDKRLILHIALIAGEFVLVSALASISYDKALSSLISIFSYFALMVVAGSKQWNDSEKKLIMVSILVSCCYFAIQLILSVSVMKRATISSSSDQSADQNVLSANIALGGVTALYGLLSLRRIAVRTVLIAAYLTIAVGILCTGSRSGLICLLVGTVFLAFSFVRKNRRGYLLIVFLALMVVVGAYIVLYTDVLNNETILERMTDEDALASSGRTGIWMEYLEILGTRMDIVAAGTGYGNSTIMYSSYYGNNWPPATHNDVLCLVCETGLIGLSLVAWFWIFVWKKNRDRNDMLGRAYMLIMLTAGMSVDIFNRYGWWNAMILAYMGIGAIGGTENEK